MNILSYQNVEEYLSNKQVYFKMEFANSDMKTIASANKVHEVGSVEVKSIRKGTICLSIEINSIGIELYVEKSDLEFFAFVKRNFIPVKELVKAYLNN